MTQLDGGNTLTHNNGNEEMQHNNAENAQHNANTHCRPTPKKRRKQFEINIASQNVHGRMGCHSDDAVYIDLFNEMLKSIQGAWLIFVTLNLFWINMCGSLVNLSGQLTIPSRHCYRRL